MPIIAEDLGVITRDVDELRMSIGAPGMVVLQFAFGSGPTNIHLPHNHYVNSICYPGQPSGPGFCCAAASGLMSECDLTLLLLYVIALCSLPMKDVRTESRPVRMQQAACEGVAGAKGGSARQKQACW